MNNGAAIVFAWNVFGCVNRYHTVLFQNCVAVNAVANEFAMRNRRHDEGRIQSASQLRHVVGESSAACHMQMCRLMNDIGALLNARDGQQIVQRNGRVHLSHLRGCLSLFFNEINHQIARYQRAVGPCGTQAVSCHKTGGNGGI